MGADKNKHKQLKTNKMNVTGKLKLVNEAQSFASGFVKREFVITTDEKYPQDLKFELVKEKVTDIDKYPIGSSIDVSFNLRGQEYQGKYFVSLQAWKIDSVGAVAEPKNYDPDNLKSDLPF
jgi:hypothetical protein